MKIELYVPTAIDVGILQRVRDVCIDRWGGCTLHAMGHGFWKDDAGKVESERVEILSVLIDTAEWERKHRDGEWNQTLHDVRQWFDNVSSWLRVKGNQHTVLYSIDGQPRYIGKDTIITPTPTGLEG